MTVYIGFMMLLSFAAGYLLLLGTARLTGFPGRETKLLIASILSAAYSGACLMPSFSFLRHPVYYLVFTVLICITAFGWEKNTVLQTILYFLLSLTLMGMAGALRQNRPEILALLLLALLLLSKAAPQSVPGGNCYLPVTVRQGGQEFHFTALVDTGNRLRDPVTGDPVTVVGPRQAMLLTGLTKKELSDPLGTMVSSPLKGLRLVPYKTIGCSSGMLLGMKFPSVTLGTRQGPALLAFAPEGLGENGRFEALTGGSLC